MGGGNRKSAFTVGQKASWAQGHTQQVTDCISVIHRAGLCDGCRLCLGVDSSGKPEGGKPWHLLSVSCMQCWPYGPLALCVSMPSSVYEPIEQVSLMALKVSVCLVGCFPGACLAMGFRHFGNFR